MASKISSINNLVFLDIPEIFEFGFNNQINITSQSSSILLISQESTPIGLGIDSSVHQNTEIIILAQDSSLRFPANFSFLFTGPSSSSNLLTNVLLTIKSKFQFSASAFALGNCRIFQISSADSYFSLTQEYQSFFPENQTLETLIYPTLEDNCDSIQPNQLCLIDGMIFNDSLLDFQFYNFKLFGNVQFTLLKFISRQVAYRFISIQARDVSSVNFAVDENYHDLFDLTLDNVQATCTSSNTLEVYYLTLKNSANLTVNYLVKESLNLYPSHPCTLR